MSRHHLLEFRISPRPSDSPAAASCAAVDDVSFELRRGETLGLVGESGSGKSVTALSILRLVQPPGRDRTAAASASTGRDLLELSEREMRAIRGAEIGFIFQEPMTALNPVFTIGDQIAEALLVHGRAHAARGARAKAIELLEAVRIPDPAAARARLPASAVGRHAPARAHRHGAGLPARAAHRRRADDGARRHDSGADSRSAARDEGTISTSRCCSSPTTSASSPRWPTVSP